MKILYLKPDRGRRFFYADPAEVRVTESERTPGALGWIGRKWDETEARWKSSDGIAARWTRRVWDRLHARTRPDEPMLAKLATAETVVVHHPPTVSEKKVRAAWRRYLAARAGSHGFWLVVDGILAPITGVVLWLLPGPNVVAIWFGYRAYHHNAIVRAIRRAHRSPSLVEFRADDALNPPVQRDSEGRWTHPAVADSDNLRRHVEHRGLSNDSHDHDHDHDHEPDPDVLPTGRA